MDYWGSVANYGILGLGVLYLSRSHHYLDTLRRTSKTSNHALPTVYLSHLKYYHNRLLPSTMSHRTSSRVVE